MPHVETILGIFGRGGESAYFGEAVSVVEHGLQAALFARQEGAEEPLILAALLHDVGHLVVPAPDSLSAWRHDAQHEISGSQWLSQWLRPAVTEPIRMHVAAKRYLCATAASYFERLSAASRLTLELQGGPMSEHEAALFKQQPFFREALKLRLWDERAKVEGLQAGKLDDYRAMIERQIITRPQ